MDYKRRIPPIYVIHKWSSWLDIEYLNPFEKHYCLASHCAQEKSERIDLEYRTYVWCPTPNPKVYWILHNNKEYKTMTLIFVHDLETASLMFKNE